MYVAFVLSGPLFDADACTAFVGLQPTKVSQPRPSALQNVTGVAAQSWVISRQGFKNITLGDAFGELLSVVWPKRARIKSFAKRSNLSISFDAFVYIRKTAIPVLTIDARILKRMAWFEAAMGIDTALV